MLESSPCYSNFLASLIDYLQCKAGNFGVSALDWKIEVSMSIVDIEDRWRRLDVHKDGIVCFAGTTLKIVPWNTRNDARSN